MHYKNNFLMHIRKTNKTRLISFFFPPFTKFYISGNLWYLTYRFSDLPNIGEDHGFTLAQPAVVAVGIFDSHLHSSSALAGGIQCFHRGIRICRLLHITMLSWWNIKALYYSKYMLFHEKLLVECISLYIIKVQKWNKVSASLSGEEEGSYFVVLLSIGPLYSDGTVYVPEDFNS